MNINELKPVLAALYNANMPAMLWGQPGIGKSTVFRAVAEILKEQLGLTGPVLERHEVRAFRERGGDMADNTEQAQRHAAAHMLKTRGDTPMPVNELHYSPVAVGRITEA